MTDQEHSRYDSLYDKYSNAPSPKKGTKYERLVAFVFKALQSRSVVVHDIKLLGDSEVRHQIDVAITQNGKPLNVLIECKDFDVAQRPVGLGIIRDFRSVVEDIKPDQAIVVTCNKFTRDAKKFAKAKGIKLAVLRQFQESDLKGRFKTVRLGLHILHVSEPIPAIYMSNERHQDKLNHDLMNIGATGGIWQGQPVFVLHEGEREQINNFITKKVNGYPRSEEGPVRLAFQNVELEVEKHGAIPIEAFIIDFNVYHDDVFYDITSSKVAELILSTMEGNDIIIFDDNLAGFQIDEETGEIRPRA